MDYTAQTPETEAFMNQIDDSEIDLHQVEAQLQKLEIERDHARSVTAEKIHAAATAIANARGNRRGVPAMLNIVALLPEKLRTEVFEDAEAALKAALGN